jgi:hypothetical protein
MSDREDRLRSLLEKVRGKRPAERVSRAGDALERIRTASGTTVAAAAEPPPAVRPQAQPTPLPRSFSAQVPSSPLPEPPTSPTIESPTRYSSQPPRVERPLSVEPRARSIRPSSGAPASPSRVGGPESIRPQSVAPTGQPVIYATEQPEFPRPKTFGDLLELTLSLRPR